MIHFMYVKKLKFLVPLSIRLRHTTNNYINHASYLVFVKVIVEVESFVSHLIQICLSDWQAEE